MECRVSLSLSRSLSSLSYPTGRCAYRPSVTFLMVIKISLSLSLSLHGNDPGGGGGGDEEEAVVVVVLDEVDAERDRGTRRR